MAGFDPAGITWDSEPKDIDHTKITWDETPVAHESSLLSMLLNPGKTFAPPDIGSMSEDVAQMTTGLAGSIPAGLAGLGTAATNALHTLGGHPELNTSDAADVSSKIQDALTYHPRASDGKLAALAGIPMALTHSAGGMVMDAKPLPMEQVPGLLKAPAYLHNMMAGSPLAATGVETGLNALMFKGGGEVLPRDPVRAATAPTAEALSAAEHITAGQPDPVAAQTAQGTASLMDAVRQADAQVQSPPVPNPVIPAAPPVQEGRAVPHFTGPQVAAGQHLTPPPPALAAKLNEMTGGDPAKIGAIIQQATGGNLKPGETPHSLVQAAQEATPNELHGSIPVSSGNGADGTVLDRAPDEAPARAVVETPVAAPAVEAVPPEPVETKISPTLSTAEIGKDSTPSLLEQSKARQQRIDELNSQRTATALSPDENTELHDLNQQQAGTNPLSGLPNKVAFQRDMATGDYSHAVALDVDEFKKINDSLGHGVGDLMLQHLAEDLGAKSTDDLKFYHLSGDEYAAAAKGDPTARMQAITDEFDKKPITLREVDSAGNKVDHQFQGVGISHGVGEGPDAYARADVAANAAKEARRNAGTIERRREGDQPQSTPRRLISSTRDESLGGGDRGRQETHADQQVASPETDVAVADRVEPAPTKPTPEGQTEVSARNAAVDADRLARDLPEIPQAERQEWATPHAEALAKIDADANWPKRLAAEVSAKPRPLTATETMGLTHDLRELTGEHSAATKEVLKAREAGDTIGEAQALARQHDAEAALTRNHEAIRVGGTEAARSLSIRNAIVKDDYSIGRNMDRAKVAYGNKLDPETKSALEHLSAKIKEQDERIAQLEAKPKSKAPKTADERMQEKVQKQMDELNAKIQARLTACPI